jgi:hypothetical protein
MNIVKMDARCRSPKPWQGDDPERTVIQAIAECGGDIRAAIHARGIPNSIWAAKP